MTLNLGCCVLSMFYKACALIAGSFLLSIGINFFLVPYEVLDGGVIGIGLIMHYILGFRTGMVILICCIPIFTYAWKYYRPYFYNSIHGLLMSSLFIDMLYPYHFYFTYFIRLSPLESSIIGGVFVGLGISIMLRFKTSTGGTDLLAQFIANKYSINVGIVIFIIDAVVITVGGVLLASSETLLLSIITVITVGITTTLCTMRRVNLNL